MKVKEAKNKVRTFFHIHLSSCMVIYVRFAAKVSDEMTASKPII